MIRRPLCCGVLAFVIGEIVSILIGEITKYNIFMALGTGMVILVCLVWRILYIRNNRNTMSVFHICICVSLVIGILNGCRIYIPDYFEEYVKECEKNGKVYCNIEGTVLRYEHSKSSTVMIVKAKAMYNDEFRVERTYKVRLFLTEEIDNTVQIGDRICCYIQLFTPAVATNPGEFNSFRYYKARGISFMGYIDTINHMNQTESGYVDRVGRCLLKLREKAQRVLYVALNEEQAGVMGAMLLGASSNLDADVRSMYQRNGIAHILAISALHISIIGSTIYKLLRKIGMPYWIAGTIVIVVLSAYGWMTGFSGSTIRAIIMFSIMLFSDVIGRSYDMLSALSVSCLYMLVEEPVRITDTGFLLSFSAVLALGVVVPFIQDIVKEDYNDSSAWKTKWINAVISGLTIQLVTAPIIIHFYYDYPTYSFFLNLIIVPLMTPLVLCGMWGIIVYPVWNIIGVVLIKVCGCMLSMVSILCKLAEMLPCSNIHIGRMTIWQMILYYAVFGGVLYMWKHHLYKRIIVILLLYIGILVVIYPSKLTITMLDIGQGDSILIRTPGHQMILVDGGSSTRSSIGRYVITPAMKYYGSGRLDYVFVSHMDSDHVNGVEELIDMTISGEVIVRNLVLPAYAAYDSEYEELMEKAEYAGIHVMTMRQGEFFYVDAGVSRGNEEKEVVIECLYPSDKDTLFDSKNDNSMVLGIHYGAFDMLFTGDIEEAGEKRMVDYLNNYGSKWPQMYEVLKSGHHGSKNSGSDLLLDIIHPTVAVISAGNRNRYGHPHLQTLEEYDRRDIRWYCTKDSGAITIESDGSSYRMYEWKKGFHLYE